MKRLCYQSCKMVYYPVSNCTWKGTSNLYEKCLRLPAHPVIHARSVPVIQENKRRCMSLGKGHLTRLRSLWREALKCHFLKWTDHYHLKSWGLWDRGGEKGFFFWFNSALNYWFQGGGVLLWLAQPYALAKVKSWNKGVFLNNEMDTVAPIIHLAILNLEFNCF